MKFWYFQHEITLSSKKCTALFQTHNWEKSSFFNALVRVFAQIYANTWQGGHNVPPPGPNRVKTFLVPDISTFSSLPYNEIFGEERRLKRILLPARLLVPRLECRKGSHQSTWSYSHYHLYLYLCLWQYLYLHLVVFSSLTTIRCIPPSFSFSLYRIIVLPYWTPTWCHKRHFTAHLWIEMCVGCQIHKAPWSVRWGEGGAWGEFRPLDYPTSPPTAPKCHVKDWELYSQHHHDHHLQCHHDHPHLKTLDYPTSHPLLQISCEGLRALFSSQPHKH